MQGETFVLTPLLFSEHHGRLETCGKSLDHQSLDSPGPSSACPPPSQGTRPWQVKRGAASQAVRSDGPVSGQQICDQTHSAIEHVPKAWSLA